MSYILVVLQVYCRCPP